MKRSISLPVMLLLTAACAPARVELPANTSAQEHAGPANSAVFDQQSWRSAKPPPDPPGPIALPRVQRFELRNGIPLYIVENHAVPLIVTHLLINAGSCLDPVGKPGLANFVAGLLLERAVGQSGTSFAEELEQHGGAVSFGASTDRSYIGLETLTTDWERSIGALTTIVKHPSFKADELERHRAATFAEIRRSADSGPQLSAQALRSILYTESDPCGAPVQGTARSVAQITRGDVVRFHHQYWLPANYVILAVGDLDAEWVIKVLNRAFGQLHRSSAPQARSKRSNARVSHRFIIVNRPGAAQANFSIGHLGPPSGSQEWPAVMVMSQALGGFYFSRITKNLRIEKGYIYVSSSTNVVRSRDQSLISLRNGVAVDKAGVAVSEIVKEVRGIISSPPTDSELELAKDSVSNGMTVRLQANSQIASIVEDIAVNNLPADYLNTYYEKLQAVTTEDVANAARKYLAPGELSIVVVGPSERLERDQELLSLGTPEVLGADQFVERPKREETSLVW